MASNFKRIHNPTKPSASFESQIRRQSTLSLAVPSSILHSVQTRELRINLAGQIARIAAIYAINEIIVYNESDSNNDSCEKEKEHQQYSQYHHTTPNKLNRSFSNSSSSSSVSSSSISSSSYPYMPTFSNTNSNSNNNNNNKYDFMDEMDEILVHVLEYLEMPQYLRKTLIPFRPSLKLAGILPPLHMPHHLRKGESSVFREGAIVHHPENHINHNSNNKRRRLSNNFSESAMVEVDVGLENPILAHYSPDYDGHYYHNNNNRRRVTVRMPEYTNNGSAQIVHPNTPVNETGLAWGYKVRYASSLENVFAQSSYDSPYDLTIGTSERGRTIDQLKLQPFHHALIVFGGLQGLELTVEKNPRLGLPASRTHYLFDEYINVCPRQASRTIRTEEAIPIALSQLCPILDTTLN